MKYNDALKRKIAPLHVTGQFHRKLVTFVNAIH